MALTPEQQKIQELEAKISRLEREKAILKKATALLMLVVFVCLCCLFCSVCLSRWIWSVPCLMCRDPVTSLIDDDVITSMSIACACAAVCTRSLNKVVKRLAAARSGTCCKKAALR